MTGYLSLLEAEDACEFPIVEPHRLDGEPLSIVIETIERADTMADESYPAAVTVEFRGTTYRGCGRSL